MKIPVESLLSQTELTFLAHHAIPTCRVIDARALGLDERRTAMHREDALLAVGEPCRNGGHRLRTGPGHCVVCDPKRIAFALRHRRAGQVYVARSARLVLTKVGSAGDALARLAQLNGERYGGAGDWQLVDYHACAEAGRVESEVQRALVQFAAKGRYQKDGKLTECYELFNCPAGVAVLTLRNALNLGPPAATPVHNPARLPVATSPTTWRAGARVQHPKRPEWGDGVLLTDAAADVARILFDNGGERTLSLSLASLRRL